MSAVVSENAIFEFLAEAATEQRAPSEVIYDDKPEYTRILMLHAEGHSTARIAREVGYSVGHINLIKSQIWYKNKYRELIALSGADRIAKLYTNELEDNLDTLRDIRDNAKSASARLQAVIYMTDRVLGKPVQQVVTERKPVFDLTNIDAELAELQREKGELQRQINLAEHGK